MARIAVTGAGGFIGAHAVRRLQALGHEVVAVGRTRPGARAGAAFVETDLLRAEHRQWLDEHRPDRLLHLAWYAEHGKFWSSPLNADWCEATARLVENFCASGGQRIVMAGTCAEYDWSQGICREDRTPLRPHSAYGREKDRARRLSADICARHQVPLAWGRIFLPFGPGEDSRRLLPSLVACLLGRRAPFPVNCGHRRDFLPVEAVAEAFAWLVDSEAEGAFNICSGKALEVGEIVQRLARLLNADPAPLLRLARRELDYPPLLAGDNRALAQAGWKFEGDLDGCLQAYAASLRGSTEQ